MQTPLLLPARPRTAIGYVRVSSREQSIDGLSLTVQARRIRDYAEACGFRLVEVVADPGVTAGRPLAKRAGGRRVVGALEGGEASILIACKLDRLFRDTLDSLANVASWRVSEVAIHIVSDGTACLDTSTPHGRMMLTMRVAFAEMERHFASERTKDVMAWKRSQGLHTGGKVKLGYRVDKTGHLIEEPREQECLRLMREMWDDGRGARPWAIYRHFAEHVPHPRGSSWTYETIKRHLPGWKVGYRRERTEYPDALKRRVKGLRSRGVPLPDIGRQLVKEGWEPMGEKWWTGTLCKIARRG